MAGTYPRTLAFFKLANFKKRPRFPSYSIPDHLDSKATTGPERERKSESDP